MAIPNYGSERPDPSYEPTDDAPTGTGELDDFINLIQGRLAKQGQSWVNTGNEQVLVDANGNIIQRLPINKSTAGGGSSSSSSYNVSDVGATSAALQRTNQELERLSLEQKAASDAALLALQQGNAAEAKRQFDISSQLAQQKFQLDQQLATQRQQEFERTQQLAESKFGFDVFRDRNERAANPRNWLSTFFENRGQPAPEMASRTGNTEFGAGDFRNFSQTPFQGSKYIQDMPGQSATSVAGGPVSTQGNPNNPFAGTNINFGGSPTTADKAMINGVETWAGGPFSGKPVASSPANAGDLTPFLRNPAMAAPAASQGPAPANVQVQQQPLSSQLSSIANIPGVELSPWARSQMAPAFAMGGTLKMMGPHAIVDMMTGQIKGVAGEAGPETAKFSGKVIATGGGKTEDPLSQYLPPGYQDSAYDTSGVFTGQSAGTLTGSAPVNSTSTGTTAPVQGWTQEQLQAMIDAANQANASLVQSQQTPTTTSTIQPPAPPPPPPPPPPPTTEKPPIIEPTGEAPAQPTIDPIFTPPPPPPLSQTSFSPATSSPSGGGPSNFMGAVDLTGFPASGNPNSILSQLNQNNNIPPFLRRILEQQRGNQAFGTDVPQSVRSIGNGTDVPLLSKMAILQMSPSERAAFMAYISAYGVDPDDYLAQVEAASPSPEQFINRPIGPKFLYTPQ